MMKCVFLDYGKSQKLLIHIKSWVLHREECSAGPALVCELRLPRGLVKKLALFVKSLIPRPHAIWDGREHLPVDAEQLPS
jgi:hypothetical protein